MVESVCRRGIFNFLFLFGRWMFILRENELFFKSFSLYFVKAGPLEDEMDQKENLCKVQEDNLGTFMKKKRNRKGGGFNLRKSLAWNQAFFTEEGAVI